MKYSDIKNVENKKYIFIDCFDTIIFRECDDRLVIQRWLQNISQDFSVDCELINKIWRQLQENRRINKRDTEEESFETVCNFFYTRLNYILSMNISFEEFYEYALNRMIEIELAVQYLNEEIVNLLQELKNDGKEIFCVTDFYMPRSAIQEFFGHLGILELFDDIFVSSDIGKRKSSGTLYQFILNMLACAPADAIMIGDNKKSDYQIPKRIGITSYLYKSFNREKTQDFFDFGEQIIDNERKKNNSFGVYAFPLYYFCEKLYEQLNAKGLTRVYFFAREGEPLKELFEAYMKVNSLTNIETKYLYVSRQSTYLPSLSRLDDETFDNLRTLSKNISVLDFIESIGLTQSVLLEMPEYTEKEKFAQSIHDFFESKEFQCLLEDERFRKVFERERLKAKSEAQCYFSENGIKSGDRIAIVDIGWKGSIQDNLHQIFDGEITLLGYYYGLLGDVCTTDSNRKYGLIFTDYPIKSQYYDTFKISYRFLESLLYASHGSCRGYLDSEAVLSLYSDKEKELYTNARVYQVRIRELFVEIAEYIKKYHITDSEMSDCMNKLQIKYQLGLTRRDIQQIYYMYDRLKLNFGSSVSGKNDIKKILRIIKNMSAVEICSKVLIQLEKRRLKPIASFMRCLFLRKFMK